MARHKHSLGSIKNNQSINLIRLTANVLPVFQRTDILLDFFQIWTIAAGNGKKEFMNKNLIILMGLAVAAFTTRAGATEMSITIDNSAYADAANLFVGSGIIDVENGLVVSGSMTVTAGDLTELDEANPLSYSTWTLLGGAQTYTSGSLLSADGNYIYDNAVYLNNNNPEYTSIPSLMLDDYGLLFTEVTPHQDADEFNLWANSNGSYELNASHNRGNDNFDTILTPADITISPIPEPSTWTFLMTGLGSLALLRRRATK